MSHIWNKSESLVYLFIYFASPKRGRVDTFQTERSTKNAVDTAELWCHLCERASLTTPTTMP